MPKGKKEGKKTNALPSHTPHSNFGAADSLLAAAPLTGANARLWRFAPLPRCCCRGVASQEALPFLLPRNLVLLGRILHPAQAGQHLFAPQFLSLLLCAGGDAAPRTRILDHHILGAGREEQTVGVDADADQGVLADHIVWIGWPQVLLSRIAALQENLPGLAERDSFGRRTHHVGLDVVVPFFVLGEFGGDC